MENQNSCKDAALAALNLGLRPIPVGSDKKALVEWKEFQEHAPTPEAIEYWWKTFPTANVAILTGTKGGISAIDFDPGHDQWPPIGQELPSFCVVQTPRGGRHYYIPHFDGIRNSSGKLGHAIDVRGEGGYILIPPSTINNNPYKFLIGSFEDVLAEYKIPDWLLTALKDNTKEPVKIVTDLQSNKIPESKRNATLASMAGSMRRKNMPPEAIREALLLTNQTQCSPPLALQEVETIASSIGRYEPAPATFNRTDTGNAELFTELYGDHVRYDHRRGRWLIWQNHWWAEDQDGEIYRKALNAVRHRYFRAMGIEDLDIRKKEAAHAIASESKQKLEAMLSLTKNMIPISESGEIWDTNPWLFGVENGIIDLTTGQLRPGKPEDRITIHSPTTFNPNSQYPLFKAFLEKITDQNDILIDYLQRLAGLCLTGYSGVQILFILWGEGANGKSTFVDTLSDILGPHATEAPPTLMIVKRNDDHPTEIADLSYRRLIIASENEKNATLKIQLVKKLTGNKKLKGRFMHRDYFDFERTFKTMLITNNKPIIRENTNAVKRRIALIPFTVQIPESEWILNYHEILKTEQAGILNWMIEGCLKFIESKMQMPEFVKEATKIYLEEQNPVTDFIENCLEIIPQAFVSRASIWDKYLDYCKKNNERFPLSKRDLFECLKNTPNIAENQQRVNGIPTRGFSGIGLKYQLLSDSGVAV